MMFWITLAAYEAVWFVTVIGAGHGLVWPALAATGLFTAWRLCITPHRATDLRLMALACVLGLLFDGALVAAHVLSFAAPWPAPIVPAWMLALWIAFALTIVPLFGTLHARPWLAALVGVIGGPLSYLAAARGWDAVHLLPPRWHAMVAIAIGWGICLPILTAFAHRRAHAGNPGGVLQHGSAP